MREALITSKRRGRGNARMVSVPAPVGGWNAKDALSAMGKTDALTLENYVVVPGGIKVRPGFLAWATGLGGPIETVMEWAPSSGSSKLFAATGTDIFDVTLTGAVGASVQTGLTSGRWQHVNFSTPAGNYLVAVNGVDAVRNFNGTAWSQPVITGPTNSAAFISVMVHQNRLWFLEKGTRRVWYLPVQAISGAATVFDAGSLFDMGGEIIAFDSWTRDGGRGTEDNAVFITSRGQAIVYAGTDPAAASTWSLVGIFRIPEPLGRRCTYRLGAELLVLTTAGPIPLSRSMGLSAAGQANTAMTDKVSAVFRDLGEVSATAFGWQMIEWPRARMLICNAPVREAVEQNQLVFGTDTAGWSKFTGWNAGCFGLFGSDLFFGGNDGVVRKATGYADAGAPILATYQHAFLDAGTRALKRFTLARPRMMAASGYIPAAHIRTDFDTSPISYRVIPTAGTSGDWDTSDWDVTDWGAETVAVQDWQSVDGVGSAVSVAFRTSTVTPLMLNGIDLAYEVGGLL